MDEEAVRRVARVTIEETFTALGVDMTKPDAVISVQHDFAFLRSARLGARFLRNAAVTAFCTVMASAVGGLIWKLVVAAHATAPR